MLLVAPGSLNSLRAHLKLPPHPFTVETRFLYANQHNMGIYKLMSKRKALPQACYIFVESLTNLKIWRAYQRTAGFKSWHYRRTWS